MRSEIKLSINLYDLTRHYLGDSVGGLPAGFHTVVVFGDALAAFEIGKDQFRKVGFPNNRT